MCWLLRSRPKLSQKRRKQKGSQRYIVSLFYAQNLGGGVDRTRTDHLSNANAALYQMSYYPSKFIITHIAATMLQ